MQYALLAQKFYQKHQHHKEILQKPNRPYCIIVIKINNLDIGIPFRSRIKHKYAFFTVKPKKDIVGGGLDYTKAVVLNLQNDIDYTRKAFIRPSDYKVLLGREYRIKEGFTKFLKIYIEAVKNPDLPENKGILQNSSLQYFHAELGLT